MRGYIQNKLVTENTVKLTAIIVGILVFITTALTAALSFLVLRYVSMEFLLANLLLGTLIPASVAPPAINLFKQVNAVQRANLELSSENTEIKKLEREADQKARDMQAVNELAIECAAALPETDILALIAEKLREITQSVAVGMLLYDAEKRTLTTQYIAVSNPILSAANQLVGLDFKGMVHPISQDVEYRMVTNVVENFSDLTDVSQGFIPKPAAMLIRNMFGVKNFIGLGLANGDKLIGGAILAQQEGISDLDNEVYKALAHVAAVSIQRESAEDALRESENKFRTLIENLSEGILLLDEHGSIIEWNKAQENITDVPRENVIGKPIWDVQFNLSPETQRTPEFYERMKQRARQILTSGEFTNFNRPIIGPIQSANGTIKHILQTSFPIHSLNGYRIGSIMRDISSQVQAEADRNALIVELKSKNKELEQFTYTVSHDLKAPLVTIKGFLGLLEKDIATGNMELLKKDISRISGASDKMQRLLNELLELSRIGRIVNPSLEVPFEKIVQDAIASVQGRLDARHVQVHVMNDLPIIFVDQARIHQVVQNLLDNAAKFMGDQSDPHVEVGVQGSDTEEKPIFYVKDNGIGIEPRQLENVLGLFQKLDVNAEGTGIGLALVKRIIEVHGGRIWIESDGLGKGTTVYFTLPVPS